MNNPRVTCIIPFYNERKYISAVLDAVCRIKGITQIICVDDGSNDNTSRIIDARYPAIKLIRLQANHGKSYAVKKGLQFAHGEHILLIDADLRNINTREIDKAITAISRCSFIDMIILRRLNATWLLRMFRIDTLLSGERILRKQDLLEIFRHPVSGYQLEVAINVYMYKNNKTAFWSPSSAQNTFKFKKFSSLKALVRETKMYWSLVRHAGIFTLYILISRFCKEKVPDREMIIEALPGPVSS